MSNYRTLEDIKNDFPDETRKLYATTIKYNGWGSHYTDEFCAEYSALIDLYVTTIGDWFGVKVIEMKDDYMFGGDLEVTYACESKENLERIKNHCNNTVVNSKLERFLEPIKSAIIKASQKDLDGYTTEYEYV